MLVICAVNIIKIKVDKKDKLLFCFFVVWGFVCFVFVVFIWFYFVWLSFFIFLEKDTGILVIKLGVIHLGLTSLSWICLFLWSSTDIMFYMRSVL